MDSKTRWSTENFVLLPPHTHYLWSKRDIIMAERRRTVQCNEAYATFRVLLTQAFTTQFSGEIANPSSSAT